MKRKITVHCRPTAFIHQLYKPGVPCSINFISPGIREFRLQAPENANSIGLNNKGTDYITYTKTHKARVALGMVAWQYQQEPPSISLLHQL